MSPPDRAALIKEYDGQVKTPEDHREDGTDNEIDSDDAIKLYDELVKSPRDRLALEKKSRQRSAKRVLYSRKCRKVGRGSFLAERNLAKLMPGC